MQLLSALSGDFQGMAFSSDGKQIATALVQFPDAKGGTLQIWNVETGKLEQSLLLSGAAGAREGPSQRRGVFDGWQTGGHHQSRFGVVWTVSDGQSKFQRSMAPASLTSIGFAPLPDVLILGATGDPDGVMSWNLQTNTQLGYLDAGNPQWRLTRRFRSPPIAP